MRDQLAAAINRKECLKVFYDPGFREIEPHALGYSSENHLLLRAYQTAGESASGEHVNWKLFRLDRMRSVEKSELPFEGPRPGYKKGDKAMTRGIIAEL